MAVGSRQSVGPFQISSLDVHLINDVLRQIQEQIDILRGLTGQDLSVTVADASTVPTGSIVKALTSTTLEAAVPGSLTVTGDYVAPGQPGAISGLTANKIPKASSAKALADGSMTDNGTSVACPVLLDLSGIAAGSPNIKITSTTDTPTVVFSAGGTIHISAAPAGYLEIQDGSNTRYIPFWV